MRKIAVIDSETDPFKRGRIPKPFVWGFYDYDNYIEFETGEQLIEYLIDKPLIVYAHNGGKFDYFYLLSFLEPFSEITIINGRLSKFKIGECEFRDSFNILPVPLSAYQKTEINYSIFEKEEREKPANKKEISEYLKDDCVFLYDLVQKFIETYGLNLTLASTAMKVWGKISGLKTPKTKSYFFDEIKPFYYGGRVECFKKGIIDHEFDIVDINSAYPSVMCLDHPYGEIYHVGVELPENEKELQRCFITLTTKAQGAFPLRTKDGLNFPSDNQVYEFNITGWEYLAAIRTNTIDLKTTQIVNVISFYETINFRAYVEKFFAEKALAKELNDHGAYLIAKLMQNALYGKYGSNPAKYTESMIVQPKYIEAARSDDYEFTCMLDKWALMEKPLEESKQRFFNVAVAASITGAARAYLWESMNACGLENVLYTDTDSIATTNIGSLDIGEKLGQWDIEGHALRGGIAGKKLYCFELDNGKYKTASKGTRLKPAQILKVCEGETVTYQPDAPLYSLKSGRDYNKPPENEELLEKFFIDRKVKMT